MSKILVLVQHDQGTVQKASLCAIDAAQQLSKKWSLSGVSTVCFGPGAQKAAGTLSAFEIERALYLDCPELSHYLAQPACEALLAAMNETGAEVLVSAATTTGKDLLPRVSAVLDAGQASDIIAVNDDGTLKRPMYAGDVLADIELLSTKRVVTVRASAFEAASAASGSATVSELKVSFTTAQAQFVSQEASGGDRPELSDAEIVVSGGRAMASAENFEKYIFPLADALGAAVGASRAAVDSGYAPNDWQVGQTGKIVAPNLYIAVGISGAIQHLAGMKDSKVIVAINKDPEAPIYEIADYGLVADLFEAVPQLTEQIKSRKS